jgi:phospholipid/cholesterol/gamma-HCH transport system substrate-binding protein
VERSTALFPGEIPQLFSMIAEARAAINAANDVLVGLSNNPLLRRGIPDRAEIDSSATNPRNIRF